MDNARQVVRIRKDLWDGPKSLGTYFGREFLTNMYLYVNHDTNEFSLWETPKIPPTPEDLIAIDDKGQASQLCMQDSTKGNSTTAGGIDLPPSAIGAIIGLSILAGLALLAGVAWKVVERRNRKRKAEQVKAAEKAGDWKVKENPNWGKPHKPSELEADCESVWAVPPPILAEAEGDEGRRLKRGCVCACSCETWVEQPREMDGQGRPAELSHSPRCQHRPFPILR